MLKPLISSQNYPISPPIWSQVSGKSYLYKFLLLPFPHIPVTSIRFLSPEEVAPGTTGNDRISRRESITCPSNVKWENKWTAPIGLVS